VPSARLGWFQPGFGLLSWGCQRSPLHRHLRLESTPSCIAAPRSCLPVGTRRSVPVRHGAAFGPELPPSGRVPPLPFLPASTVCSSRHFSGLLHPETDHGVRHVSGPGLRLSPACALLPPWSGVRTRGRVPAPREGVPSPARRFAAVCRAGSEETCLARLCDVRVFRWTWSFPCGAPPFGVFPSPAALPGHLVPWCFRAFCSGLSPSCLGFRPSCPAFPRRGGPVHPGRCLLAVDSGLARRSRALHEGGRVSGLSAPSPDLKALIR
jgi:hypothetical protein